MKFSVLLDTSFFIRLLNAADPLHLNAKEYYKYLLEHKITLKISTISIAEFCVRDDMENLPLEVLQIIPFTIDHARVAGQFTRSIMDLKNREKLAIRPRTIIPNDAKLFAQAHTDKSIQYFLTSDTESKKTIALLNQSIPLRFTYIDINTAVNETFGLLF